LSVRDHISGTTRPIFTNFCACYLWPWLGPPLAAYSDMLRTSGFVDDVSYLYISELAVRRRRQAEAVGLTRTLGIGA